MRALLAVDVQEDFCEGGSLAVAGGRAVAAGIAALLPSYDVVVASTDWHVDPGEHFSDTPDYRLSWPRHCVVGTHGSRLQAPLTEEMFAAVVRKGEYAAAYSAFDGRAFEGTGSAGQPLADWLGARGVDALDVCGLATDYCVRASVLDAVTAGLSVRLLTGLIAGVAPESTARALAELTAVGVELA